MSAENNTFVRLASINVNEHVEKKQNLSYLSWAWALDQLMRADPDASWEYPEPKMFGQTMMVYCTVTAFGKRRTAFLPVMDYKNKPIPNPDAFAVNTAMQRVLVKAIALHGLGLYIYAGEDLPPDENGTVPEAEKAEEPKREQRITPTGGIYESLTVDMQNFVDDVAYRVRTCLKKNDLEGAYAELTHYANGDKELMEREDVKVALWSRFDSKERRKLSDFGDAKRKLEKERQAA